MKYIKTYENIMIFKRYNVIENLTDFLIWEILDQSDNINIQIKLIKKYSKKSKDEIEPQTKGICYIENNILTKHSLEYDTLKDAINYVQMKLDAEKYNL